MRSRNIKPGFFDDEDLHLKLGPHHAILFAGLWCIVDKQGKCEDRPIRIKANVMPYYEVDVDKMLMELEGQNFIKRYSVNGTKYLKVLKFEKHQHPHHTEKDSLLPDPPSIKNGHRMRTVTKPLSNGYAPSDSLNTDSLYSFEEFWKCYPKKKGKGYAKKAWLKIKPDDTLIQRMIYKVGLLKGTDQWQKDGGKYIPHPSTWLNGEEWDDEVEASKATW